MLHQCIDKPEEDTSATASAATKAAAAKAKGKKDSKGGGSARATKMAKAMLKEDRYGNHRERLHRRFVSLVSNALTRVPVCVMAV